MPVFGAEPVTVPSGEELQAGTWPAPPSLPSLPFVQNSSEFHHEEHKAHEGRQECRSSERNR